MCALVQGPVCAAARDGIPALPRPAAAGPDRGGGLVLTHMNAMTDNALLDQPVCGTLSVRGGRRSAMGEPVSRRPDRGGTWDPRRPGQAVYATVLRRDARQDRPHGRSANSARNALALAVRQRYPPPADSQLAVSPGTRPSLYRPRVRTGSRRSGGKWRLGVAPPLQEIRKQ
jgi:hypothetical protein